MDYKEDASFQKTFLAADKLKKVDITQPLQNILGTDSSLPVLVQSFVNAQAQTNHQLFVLLGEQTANSESIRLNDDELTPAQQRDYIRDLATKQNILSRHLEKSLQAQIDQASGLHVADDLHLIHPPPKTWGNELKVSDSGLKMIPDFSGDSSQNESLLGIFFRAVYSLANTANLTETATLAVIIRKLIGSAHELVDSNIKQAGGLEHIQLKQIVSLLEKKFLLHVSPISAQAALHALRQGTLTYSQLQAKVTRLARLATRMEPSEDRDNLTRVKEMSSFLMAISATDRAFINNENARRQGQNLSTLGLDQMVDILLRVAADKLSFTDFDHINVVNDQVTRCPINSPHSHLTGAVNKTTDQQLHPSKPKKKTLPNKKRPFITCQMANVSPHACLMCGDTSHLFKSQDCVYVGLDLMTSPCRHCGIGVHPHQKCVHQKTRAGQRRF